MRIFSISTQGTDWGSEFANRSSERLPPHLGCIGSLKVTKLTPRLNLAVATHKRPSGLKVVGWPRESLSERYSEKPRHYCRLWKLSNLVVEVLQTCKALCAMYRSEAGGEARDLRRLHVGSSGRSGGHSGLQNGN